MVFKSITHLNSKLFIMKKPDRHEFVEEKKFDGVLYTSVNEEAYRHSVRKYEDYLNKKRKHQMN